MEKLKIGVIGAGRLGCLHVENLIRRVPKAEVVALADVRMDEEMRKWAEGLGIPALYDDPYQLIASPEVEAVVICSSTNTHVDLTIAACKAGKSIFLEKPIDREIDRAEEALKAIKESGVKVQMGYVRRFDHDFKAVQETAASGKIGRVNVVKITTRDAEPPSFEYAKVSGGIYLDMMIHDFDMARFLTGSEVDEVVAYGAARMDPKLEEIDDVDVTTVMLKMKNGVLCVIDNARKSGFGYNLTAEVSGDNGCVQSFNDTPNTTVVSTMDGIISQKPKWFFLTRFLDAFVEEMISFTEDILADRMPAVGVYDGMMSLVIAKAADLSRRENRIVRMSEFGY